MAARREEPKRKTATKKAGSEEFSESEPVLAQEGAPEQFSESQQEEITTGGIEGKYRRGVLTLELGPELLPSDEQLILISTSDKTPISYQSYYRRLITHLNIEEDYFHRMEADFEYSNYSFFQLSQQRIIGLISFRPEEEINSISSDFIRELTSSLQRFYKIELSSIYDSSLYYSLSNTPDELRYSPLHFIEEVGLSESSPLSYTLPYPSSAERRLFKDLSEGWKELLTHEEEHSVQKSPQDKIDFHLDDPALEDKLGRKPIANSLAKLINDDIFGNEKCHAFMAHLQGRWGEGKSSFMKFLEEGLQDAGNNCWIVVHYNAWKNQGVDPPWWTFLDAIYKQGNKQISKIAGKKYRRKIKINENIRRLNSGVLLGLSIAAFAIYLVLSFYNLLEIDFQLETDTKTILSIITLAGTVFAIGQAWSKFFILDTPENAKLFMRRTENPSAYIKQHFEGLVKDLQTKHKKGGPDHHIAVFIDDLDRCDGKFVVSLLEGIQTMFNEQKVFYLVAADKHWVAKSFENIYSEYTDTVKTGTKLGYSFIEKNFQLSIRLPNPSKSQISRYWGHILKHRTDNQTRENEDKEGLKEKLKETGQEAVLSGETDLEELAEEYNTTIEDAQSIMLETVNETTEDIEHLLMEHHELLGNNPRAVKRLANQYTVYRNLVLIEQNKVDPLKLFRWVVLQNRWPVLIDKLEQDPTHINDYDELLEELNLVSYSIDIDYVMGKEEQRLTTEDVITFMGIGSLAPQINYE